MSVTSACITYDALNGSFLAFHARARARFEKLLVIARSPKVTKMIYFFSIYTCIYRKWGCVRVWESLDTVRLR